MMPPKESSTKKLADTSSVVASNVVLVPKSAQMNLPAVGNSEIAELVKRERELDISKAGNNLRTLQTQPLFPPVLIDTAVQPPPG